MTAASPSSPIIIRASTSIRPTMSPSTRMARSGSPIPSSAARLSEGHLQSAPGTGNNKARRSRTIPIAAKAVSLCPSPAGKTIWGNLTMELPANTYRWDLSGRLDIVFTPDTLSGVRLTASLSSPDYQNRLHHVARAIFTPPTSMARKSRTPVWCTDLQCGWHPLPARTACGSTPLAISLGRLDFDPGLFRRHGLELRRASSWDASGCRRPAPMSASPDPSAIISVHDRGAVHLHGAG